MSAADAGARPRPPATIGQFTVEDLPWLSGFLVGVATYLLAYALVGGLWAFDLASNLDLPTTTRPESTISYLGWVFYSAHRVPVDVSLFTFDFVALADSATTLPAIAYYALPPLLLTSAGILLVRVSRFTTQRAGRRALAGTMVTVGYLPAMVLGVFVASTPEGQPQLALAFLLGLGYAIAFGAVGGVLGGRQL